MVTLSFFRYLCVSFVLSLCRSFVHLSDCILCSVLSLVLSYVLLTFAPFSVSRCWSKEGSRGDSTCDSMQSYAGEGCILQLVLGVLCSARHGEF